MRGVGYQCTQWAVTVPVSDPISDPPLATDPLSYAPLYVVRDTGGLESLERVATLRDYAGLPQAELTRFEGRRVGGDALLATALPGDTLRIDTNIPYWLQAEVPYTNQEFIVAQVPNRAQGTGAKCFTDGKVQVPGYAFTNEDVGRWLNLAGFSAANNGYACILSYAGSTATCSRTFTANETGGTWAFPTVQIETSFPGVEPRYFPTKERNLAWSLVRGGVVLATGGGGATLRNSDARLFRSVRNTTVAPTQASALALFEVSRKEAEALQRAASRDGTSFTVLLTSTFGP